MAANSTRLVITEPRAAARYQPLVVVLAAASLGIFIDRQAWSFVPHSFETWWLAATAALVGWFALLRMRLDSLAIVALLVCVASIGGAWHHARWNLFSEDDLGRAATLSPQPICLEVIAEGAPREVPQPSFDPLRSIPSAPQSRLIVNVVAMRDGHIWHSASGRTQMSVSGVLTDVHAGDRLQVFAHVASPTPAANPGEFDFAQYARANRELSVLRVKVPSCITLLQSGSVLNPTRWFDSIRGAGDQLLNRFITPSLAGTAGAVLLGEREEVDRDTNEAYLETGTVHILVVAGLHVGILAWLLFKALRMGWLSRKAALAGIMIITGVYMLVTGAGPSVVRATLLVWVVCGGLWLGRPRIGLNSLALAALLLLAINPTNLFQTGVQLSFLSVAALMWAAMHFSNAAPLDPLDRLIRQTRPWPQRQAFRFGLHLRDVFLASALLWLVVTPLTMARFHLFSPSALVLNLLLIPVLMVVMTAGFGVLAFGYLFPPLASVLGTTCSGGLQVIDSCVKAGANFPGGRFWVAGPTEAWLAVFYLAIAAAIFLPRWAPPMRWRAALFGAWCGLGLFGSLGAQSPAHALRCTFIAVGHGGAELLELPDGKTLLYDAGRLGSPAGGAQSISNFLWSRGLTHVDAILLSHADTDHYNALPELLERFSVGTVYVSPVMFLQKSRALAALHESIERSGTKLAILYAGDRLSAADGVKIDVLHPPPQGLPASDNANCLVLGIEYSGRRILLTGDLEPPGMQMVMNEFPFRADVLLAPHHGSGNSDPISFGQWCAPKYVVISGSIDDGKVARTAYEAGGAKVLNTADCGAVTVSIDSNRLVVNSFRNDNISGQQ